MFEFYLEAAREGRHKPYDAAAHQKHLEDLDDKGHMGKYPIIPIPEGFHWTSNAGGFFSYDKILSDGRAISLAGPQGNTRPRVVPKSSNYEDMNGLFLYKSEAAMHNSDEPIEHRFFTTEAQMKAIIAKWEKIKE